jgi:hypothetical protein
MVERTMIALRLSETMVWTKLLSIFGGGLAFPRRSQAASLLHPRLRLLSEPGGRA